MISPKCRNFSIVLFQSIPVSVAIYLIVDTIEIMELFDFLTQLEKYKIKVLADSVSSDKSCYSPSKDTGHGSSLHPLTRTLSES